MTQEELFGSRELTAQIENIPAAGTFLQDTYFPNVALTNAEVIDIEIYKGKRKLAPFVAPRMQGKVMKSEGKTVSSFKPAYIKYKFVTEAAEILENTNGVFYAANDPAQRAVEKLAQEMQEGKEYKVRRVEWMASSALSTGKIVVKGEGVDKEIDFGFDAAQLPVLAGAALWSNADADPIAQMRTWRRERVKAGGIAPDTATFGSDAIDAFISHPNVKDKLDNRRIELGMIDPTVLPKGVTYWGHIKDIATDIYSYDEWYVDTDDSEQPMVPAKGMIYGSSKTKAKRVHGAIKDLKALAAVEIFVKSWEEEDPSVRYVLIQSAPIVIPVEVEAFMYAEVLA